MKTRTGRSTRSTTAPSPRPNSSPLASPTTTTTNEATTTNDSTTQAKTIETPTCSLNQLWKRSALKGNENCFYIEKVLFVTLKFLVVELEQDIILNVTLKEFIVRKMKKIVLTFFINGNCLLFRSRVWSILYCVCVSSTLCQTNDRLIMTNHF